MNIMAMVLGKFKSMAWIYSPKTQEPIIRKTLLGERGYFETMLKQIKPDLYLVN
ncbi:MAG: hypothetical protein AAFN77_08575 [Planctomycetota bacterium]